MVGDDAAASPPPGGPPVPPGEPAPALPAEEVEALREAGRAWARLPRPQGLSAPPSGLEGTEVRGRPGEKYVRVFRPQSEGFEQVAPGWLEATARASRADSRLAQAGLRLRTLLVGQPIASQRMVHERLTKIKALAVLSSDALSSVAYATEQILVYLVPAGVIAYTTSIPIAAAILFLLAAVVLSYRQTIRAYPRGGGSYIVASDNLGPLAGLVAGCALMTSYTMTVSVSVASGADAILSAAPGISGFRVPMCLGFVLLLMLGNLRGIRESGSIFALPTYLFIAAMYLTVATVAVKLGTGHLSVANISHDPVLRHASQNLSLILILRAFASGASALTGIEAISDGVPAFKAPEWRNARATLTTLGLVLGTMFIGITVCTFLLGLKAINPSSPHYQTIISQLAHAAFGGSFMYLYVIVATTLILILAGNTAYSDFPRLLFFMSRDEYAPHQFRRLGDRLAYSNGIITLGILSAAAIVIFDANVTAMIPLYAIGVFTAFTMSQTGMVVRWLRLRGPGWRRSLAMNATGACITFLVLLINAVFKFLNGAWIVIVLVPILVTGAFAIHRHYAEARDQATAETPTAPDRVHPVCVVPVDQLNNVALQSLALARSLSGEVTAVHVCSRPEHMAELRARWDAWGNHVPLVIVESPYRSVLRPLLHYIDAVDRQAPDRTLVVVLPELVATRWWHQLLHNQFPLRLKAALLFRPGTVLVSVPYHLQRRRSKQAEMEAL